MIISIHKPFFNILKKQFGIEFLLFCCKVIAITKHRRKSVLFYTFISNNNYLLFLNLKRILHYFKELGVIFLYFTQVLGFRNGKHSNKARSRILKDCCCKMIVLKESMAIFSTYLFLIFSFHHNNII